jgi:hypothetical protein
MKKLYIIRCIYYGQTCQDADIGMNNIMAMGKYESVKNAKRFLKWDDCLRDLNRLSYDRIALFDLHGVICSS